MQKRNIVFLEDHRLYQLGVRYFLLHSQKNYEIECFNHPDNAIAYVEDCFTSGKRLDLIITDFTQLVGNGYRFASTVKALQAKHGIHTPILLLSILEIEVRTEIYTGLMTEVFDMYLSKSSPIEEILTVVGFLTRTNARD